MLYVTHGDGDEKLKSQDKRNLFGKLMRFHDDGTIPIDNPYYSSDSSSNRCNENGLLLTDTGASACQEIYALGLRNAFRCSINPNFGGGETNNKTIIHLMDVGAAHWEEISLGGTDQKGVNYGWPEREGPCKKGETSGVGCLQANPLVYHDPLHYYQHNDDGEGASVGGAFIPNNSGWPAEEYNNKFLYNDYIFNTIYLMHGSYDDNNNNNTAEQTETDDSDSCSNRDEICDTPPQSNQKVTIFATNIDKPVTMAFGPYYNKLDSSSNNKDKEQLPQKDQQQQALYYISRESPQSLHRISYIGSNANRKPVAIISVVDGYTTDGTEIGHSIQLDASNSYDPDDDDDTSGGETSGSSDIVLYEWDFNNNGIIDSTSVISDVYTYDTPGSYKVTLTVTDTIGSKHSTFIQVNVGNKPIPTIIEPSEGTTFAVGDVLTLKGSAFDLEDGFLTDDEESTSLSWEVRQHHEQHYHPYLDEGTFGNNIVLDGIPGPEDFYAATSSYIEILLTAYDSDGLSNTISRLVMPQKKNLTFLTVPSNVDNLQLVLDGSPVYAPEVAISWINHKLPIYAPNQCVLSGCYNFISWSDDGSQLHTINVQEEDNNNDATTYTAAYQKFQVDNGYDNNVLFIEDEYIRSGETKSPPGLNVFFEQQDNGNFILHLGNNGVSESILWETGISETTGVDYYTRLSKNGDLSTRSGTPENKGKPIWRSHMSPTGVGHYFIAVSSDLRLLSIFQGVAGNPLNILWSTSLDTGTSSEEETTTTPTTSTQQPTLSPTIMPLPTLQPTTITTGLPTTASPVSQLPTNTFSSVQPSTYSPTVPSPTLSTKQPSTLSSSPTTKTTSTDGQPSTDSSNSTTATLPNVIFTQLEYISVGETKTSTGLDVFLEQQSNGNVILHEGSNGISTGILWETGLNASDDNVQYFTRLQGDGVLATKIGTPDNKSKALWKSHVASASDSLESKNKFFLAVSSDKKTISIFKGTPENSTGSVWTDNLTTTSTPPSFSPTTPLPTSAAPTTQSPTTAKPVVTPTSLPTMLQSNEPSIIPSTTPSVALTGEPSLSPTTGPTRLPTSLPPTKSPTQNPSLSPSIGPTTASPTIPPTPTQLPTQTETTSSTTYVLVPIFYISLMTASLIFLLF